MTPNKIPLFLRELLTWHLFVFGGGGGQKREVLLIGNQLPFLQQFPVLRKGASCCYCRLGKGGDFRLPLAIVCFLCPKLVSGGSLS